MTIDQPIECPAMAEGSLVRDLAAFARACTLALLAWIAMAAALTVFVEPTWDAVVISGTQDMAHLLEGSDTRIVDAPPGYLVVRGTEPGFVRALYANGAWLVLPARAGGCIARGLRPT